MNHFIKVCSCGAVLSQCRCPSKDKQRIVVPNGCAACKNKAPLSVIWVVGRHFEDTWQILGVFDSEDQAVAACTHRDDFVGPIRLNQRQPEKVTVWPDSYYPLIEDASLAHPNAINL